MCLGCFDIDCIRTYSMGTLRGYISLRYPTCTGSRCNRIRTGRNYRSSTVRHEVLRIIAHQKLEDGDTDGAVDIFKSIAEYEKPKLARVESKVEEVKADELTDEELNAKLEELLNKNADE